MPFTDYETILLTKNGQWLSNGEEITHEVTRKKFSQSLKKDSQGYFLSIGPEVKRIQVEDTAYFVTQIQGDQTKGFQLFISDGTQEELNPDTLSYRPSRLVTQIKQQTEEAKFLKGPYFDLLQLIEEDSKGYFLLLNQRRIDLQKKI